MGTAEWIITAGALLTAVSGFVALAWKLFRWIDHQKEQDERVDKLEHEMKDGFKQIRAMHHADQDAAQTELTLVVFGLLACLKGLQEQGCDGPVTDAVNKIEKHINQKAHGQI